MPAPINYMGMIEKPDIAGRFARGYKIGEMLGQGYAEEQYKKDMLDAYQNPTPDKFVQLQLKYPDKASGIKGAWDTLDSAQQDAIFRNGMEISNAMRTGNLDVAKQKLQTTIDANKNAGKDTSQYERILNTLDSGNTNGAITAADLFLSSANPKKYEDIYKARQSRTEEEKMQAETAEAKAKAQKAATQARFAESQAVADLTKTGWDIQKLQNDISVSKENQRIAAMQAEAKKTTDALQLQELQGKIADAEAARDQKVRERVADLSNANSNAQNLFNTVDDIIGKSFERDDKGEIVYEKDAKGNKVPVFSGVLKSATGPIESMLPTFGQDVADLEEQVNTLKSQVTMANLDKLKGVLSDNDMKTLQTALQSLSLRQSPQALVKNLTTIKDLTKNAQDIAKNKYGLPENMPAPQQEVSVSVPGVGAIKFPNQKAADDFMQKLKSRGGL